MTRPDPDGIVWRTSSYTGSGSACVEVGWRTSSYTANGSACVEVAPTPAGVLVRDSKDPEGPTLAVSTAAWRVFLGTVTR
ncbi:MAG: DUF397 domain-containing protein [Pseudonocardiaceae bacterium]